MTPGRLTLPDRVLRIALCTLVLYLSFRYPLQINFSGTSPTYSDTPPILQAGKYVIAFVFCALVVLFAKVRVPNDDMSLIIAGSAAIALTCAIKFAISGEFRFIEPVLWPMVAAILCLHATELDTATIEKFVLRLFAFSFAMEIVQVVLFLTIGRLPALAYEDSISVRFGSFLDDPNGFSGLCFLFIGWAVGTKRTWRASVVFWGSVLMIMLSQSLTAFGFLMLVLLVLGVRRAIASPVVGLCGGVVLSMPVVYFADELVDVAVAVLENKQGSINTHTKHGLMDIIPNGGTQFLFGSDSFSFYESWWNLSLSNFGVLWTAPFMVLGIYTLFRLFKEYSGTKDIGRRAVFCGFLVFSGFFLFGSLNLPFFIIFPNSFIFYCIVFMSLGKKIPTPPPIAQSVSAQTARKKRRRSPRFAISLPRVPEIDRA